MADGTVAVLESTDPAAKLIDNEQLTVATKTVERQRVRAYGMAAGDEVDGYSATLGATADAAWSGSGSGTIVAILKKLVAQLAATITTDVADRAARLLGHVTLDNASLAVTGAFFQVTQPVSGTVTADTELPAAAALADTTANPTAPAVGAFGLLWNGATWDRAPGDKTNGLKVQSAQLPAALVAGRLSVDGSAVTQPVSVAATLAENLTQIAGTALAAKAVPTNADGQVAIPVYVNAQQYATYDVAARNIATGALTANTAKAVLSLEHALASAKTVRIRRIMIHAIQTTALSGLFDIEITRGTAASSAGSAVIPQPRKLTDPAAEVVVKSLPTIVAATVADNIPAGGFGATTALYSPPVLVYDWQEAGETKPYLLVAGALQSIVINVISTAAHNLTLTVSVDLTEE